MTHRVCAAGLGACLILVLALPPGVAAESSSSYVRRTDAMVSLGNQHLELQVDVSQGHAAAKCLVNKLTAQSLPLRADGFSLGLEGSQPLTAADFTLREVREEPLAQGGKRVVLQLAGQRHEATVELHYTLGDGDFFLRRQIVLQTKRPLPLRRVDVWSVGVEGEATHQGFGEPVFLGDTFWGLEFPGGHDACAHGVLTLSHHPGRTIADRFVSKSAVVGVAAKGDVAKQFQRYVKTFQATPETTRLFVNYNTWWTLMPPTQQNCLELINLFKQKLFDVSGQSFDTFTIDEGWDDKNTLWDLRKDRFPDGFHPLSEPLRAMHAAHGLWLSPSSGYGHAPWGGQAGYEQNSNAWFLCQAGPKYRQDITRVVTDLAKEYQMTFFKFDGFCASCDAEGHGHLPGEYAKEANIDAFIDLLQAVRQGRPNVFLDPTCGIWLSPWWLQYADALWGSVSDDYPDIIVPAPVVRDSATTTRDSAFRQRCREHPGFPPAAIEHLGIIVITPEKWEDNAMIVLGRGCRLLTLYINPACFQKGDRDWAFLASILKWVRHNAGTLDNTELILGDPLAREPYGYAHFVGTRGIVAVRNPFIEPQTVKVTLDRSVGLPEPASKVAFPFSDLRFPSSETSDLTFLAHVAYPYHETLPQAYRYGDVFECQLQGYETKVVQFDPSGGHPLPAGARYVEKERTQKLITYDLFGPPGQQKLWQLSKEGGGGRVAQLVLDGQRAAVDQLPKRAPLIAGFGPPEETATVQGAEFKPATLDGSWRLEGRCEVQVPAQSRATMHILCDPKGNPLAADCTAAIDGQPVSVRAVRTPEPPQQAHGPHPWTWFEFDVPSGNHAVALTVRPAKPDASYFRGEVGWWLWAELPLVARATLTVEYDQPLPEAEPLPLPIGTESQRQIVTIQPAHVVRVGNRWPKLDQREVFLDEVAPDESVQEWGQLERNRSVWQKEMLIAGQPQRRGLGTHANSRIVYDLGGGGFKKFRALVGRDQHAGDGKIAFQVWLDGQSRFDSGPMTNATPGKSVEVDVAGAAVLELRTLDGGDGISGDHGNWADAQLLR